MFNSIIRMTANGFKTGLLYNKMQTLVLNNGVRLAVEETNSPLACVSLFIQTGSRFETTNNNGISHFIEHMALNGFESMNMRRVDDCFKCIGANLTASTTREYQSFTGICPVENILELIDIMSLIITHIDFSDCAIQKGKENIIFDLKDCENSPKHVVFDYLHEAAFQGTPLAQRVIGPIKNIECFDDSEGKSFMEKQYTPHNLVLAVSGAVNSREVFSQAQTRFTHIRSDTVNSNNDFCRYTGSSMVYRDDSMPLAHVAIALEVPGYGDDDFWPLFVANCILGVWDKSQGGGDTHGAYLTRAAAVGHQCEFYEPFYITYQDIGLWGVYYVAERKKIDHLLHNIQHQWMYFCTSITDSEVKRGVNYAKLMLTKEAEGSINSCRDIGLQMLYTCKRTSLVKKFAELTKVSTASIRKIGGKYMYNKCPVVSAIGPTEALTDYSRIRSEMYWLRY